MGTLKAYSYDEIPYESNPFPQCHPDRLATLGTLFGMSPVPIFKSRVLELGCASGGNLIPMACHLPQSEFVGADLSKRHVEMGCKTIKDLNLKNVRIEHASIMDIDASWGTFDYIICHGVYSWVPDEIQDKILAISSGNLTSPGISYISYNTYPGWHMREMIRHMMLYHANQFEESGERIEQARALMDFLACSVPTENNHYGLLLKNELELIRRSRDWYLFHDHLEEVNTPVYFHQFIERAKQHGLQYLGEADFSTMLTSGFSKEIAETLGRISKNIIHTEQYMDFIRNRFFRQTILCHRENTLKRNLTSEDISKLMVASSARPKNEPVNLLPGKEQLFVTPQGSTAKADFPLTKAALMVLWGCWPRVIDLDSLLRQSYQLLEGLMDANEWDKPDHRDMLAEDLLHCFTANVVEFRTWQADFVTEPSDHPRVSKLTAYQIRKKRPVVNQRHEVVNPDSFTRQMVLTMDGTRDRPQILQRLNELVLDGILVINKNGKPLTDHDEIRHALVRTMEQSLGNLAKSALLVG